MDREITIQYKDKQPYLAIESVYSTYTMTIPILTNKDNLTLFLFLFVFATNLKASRLVAKTMYKFLSIRPKSISLDFGLNRDSLSIIG
jgi:hypothetical protein